MKLNEFIVAVLLDIEKGLKEATKKTDKDYTVKSSFDYHDGVHFDIAVTTASLDTKRGTTKTEAIQVAGTSASLGKEAKNENSQVSRIQFAVYVPHASQAEIQERQKIINEALQY